MPKFELRKPLKTRANAQARRLARMLFGNANGRIERISRKTIGEIARKQGMPAAEIIAELQKLQAEHRN